MKKSFSTAALLLTFSAVTLLSACSSTHISYRLEIDEQDAGRKTELIDTAKRVVTRRLESLGEQNANVQVTVDGEVIRLSADVSNQAVKDTILDQLALPFSMQIMSQVTENGDITVEGHGSFKATGITEKHLNWVQAGKDEDPTKGRVALEFTPEGKTLMADVFRQNKDKYIGLFVRGHLVSKLLVASDEVKDSIIITDIPSAVLAEVFADDLNLGLHVTFVPEE